jgi:hypothetical protein
MRVIEPSFLLVPPTFFIIVVSWLASFAKLHRFVEEDRCECGAIETVMHVLVSCPNLRTLR